MKFPALPIRRCRQACAPALQACLLAWMTACASSPPREAAPPAQAPAAEPPAAEPAASQQSYDEDVMYRVLAAEALGTDGDLDGAVGEYLEAALESDDPAVAERATRVAFAAQAWQQASMAADRWAVLDPQNLEAHESAALALLATADYAGAELYLRRILDLTPDRAEAWTLIARLLGRSASPEKAVAVLDGLLADYGDEHSARGYFEQSQLTARAGDLDRAYELAARAADLQPQEAAFQTWAGRLALIRNDRENGMRYVRRAWELEPQDHDLTLAYADLLARSGHEDEARQLIATMQQTPDVMLTRILFELTAGEQAAALGLYAEFAEMNFADLAEKAYYQAQAAEALDLPQEAIGFYAQVTTGDMAVAAAARRAVLMARAGDLGGARSVLAELRLNPDQAVVEESWLTEARILQEAGDTDAAMASLDLALEQFSASIPLLYAHALLAAETGDVRSAEEQLRAILAEEPDNAAALNALGYTLADQTDRYHEAEELIAQALALQPDDPSITDSMGWVMYRLGRLAEAEQYLARAWSMDRNPEIAAHLGEVLWALGRQEEARATWREGLEGDPENRVLRDTMRRLDSRP